MRIAPTITPLGLRALRLSWSGSAGATVRVFVNGVLSFGPMVVADVDKAVDINPPDPCTIEVHESEATESTPATGIALDRRPLLWWRSVSNAREYRVYVDEVLLAVVPHESWRLHHQHRLLQDVRQDGGTWTTFRVEAVTARGTSSTTAARALFAPGVPAAPTSVEVTGGAGIFDVEVTL